MLRSNNLSRNIANYSKTVYNCFQLIHYVVFLTFFISLSASPSSDNKCTRIEQYEIQVPDTVIEPVVVERTKFCWKKINFRCKEKKVEYRSRQITRTETRSRTIVECCPGYELVNGECVVPDPCKKKECTTTTERIATSSSSTSNDEVSPETSVSLLSTSLVSLSEKTVETKVDQSTTIEDTTTIATMTDNNTDDESNVNDDYVTSTTDNHDYYDVDSTVTLIEKMNSGKFSAEPSTVLVGGIETATLEDLMKAAVKKCRKYQIEEKLNDSLARLCNKILSLNEDISNTDTDNVYYSQVQTTDNIILARSESVNGSVLENAEGAIILEDETNNNHNNDNYSPFAIDNSSNGRHIWYDRNGRIVGTTPISLDALSTSFEIDNDTSTSNPTTCHRCTWSADANTENEANFLWIWMIIIIALILLVAGNTALFALIRCYKSRHQSKKMKIPLDTIECV